MGVDGWVQYVCVCECACVCVCLVAVLAATDAHLCKKNLPDQVLTTLVP